MVEGTEVLVEGGKVMGRQSKEEGVRLLAEVIGHAMSIRVEFNRLTLINSEKNQNDRS